MISLNRTFCLTFLCLPGLVQGYTNVYGNSLAACSQDGMALTGYTRTGYCVDQNDDSGSHHICIDLSSANGGNFCDVTGQDDWCSSEMPCHDDQNESCPVQNWCVCQWAFSSYLSNAGGCDEIQDIVCESINLEALKSYYKQASKYQTALDCITDRCGITNTDLYMSSNKNRSSNFRLGTTILVVGVALAAGIIYWTRSKRNTNNQAFHEQLVSPMS